MNPGHNILGPDRLQTREYADLDFESGSFLGGHWGEAGIIERGSLCRFRNSLVQRMGRDDVSDAAAKASVQMQGGEGAPHLGQVRAGRRQVKLSPIEPRVNRAMGQMQQQLALFL